VSAAIDLSKLPPDVRANIEIQAPPAEVPTIAYTVWPDVGGKTIQRIEGKPWSQLTGWIETQAEYKGKVACPLVKLASFGPTRTEKGSLRNDSNVVEVFGVEGDYDAGEMTPEAAIARLEEFQVRATVYTSWSHTPEAPKWRVLAPLARPVAPAERLAYAETLNGMLGGILAPESGVLSQSYFVGRKPGAEYRVLHTFNDPTEGWCLDEIDGIQAERVAFRQKPSDKPNNEDRTGTHDDYLSELLAGGDVHGNALRIVGRLVREGLSDSAIITVFAGLALSVAAARGQERADELTGSELQRMIDGARGKGYGRDEAPGSEAGGESRNRDKPPPDPVEEAKRLRYYGPPSPTPGMFYGPLGEWSEIATRETEASRVAVYANLLAYVGAALGRERFLWIGDTKHHPRIFTLHNGRTARGRKGTATAPVERLHDALTKDDALTSAVADQISGGAADVPRIAPHIHTGGLSSREGVAYRLRDEVKGTDKDGNETVEDPGVPDKRLWIVESEFSNTLSQGSRDGNTLSSALRDCFDGRDLAPLTKTNRTTSTAPHVTLCGQITIAELLDRIEDTAITNGFLNRFMIFWAERDKRVPFPQRTPDNEIARWVRTMRAAITNVRKNPGEAVMTDAARELYAYTYLNEWDSDAGGPVVTSLMERAPAVAVRIALILSALDQATEVSRDHIACAIEWTRYWRASVEYIWRDRARLAAVDGKSSEAHTRAVQIVAYLRKHGGEASRTELISDCFNRHATARDIDAALDYGQLQTPPMFRVSNVVTKRTPIRTYTKTIVALPKPEKPPSEPCEPCEPSATASPEHSSHDCEPWRTMVGEDDETRRDGGIVRDSSHDCEPCSDRAVIDGSHSSHSSQPRFEDL
jgi:putative DNA primase/helicase